MNIQQQVQLAQDGDHEAFLELIKHIEVRLYRISSSILKKKEDIVDAMQETIIKTYESLPQLREASFFETWAIRILINECNSILQKRKRLIPFAEIHPPIVHVPAYEAVDMRELVDQLEEDKRQLIILHYFQDIPLKQVAEIMQITESTAKTRLHRTRKLLSSWLEDNEEGGHMYENR
ncbi:sigma-70 family RNA polymerase sigma factor [Paenibacillus sp. WLX1005]|uniref:sigma-70 family RNA polymerase sigma factor n=1 Tax=Paenibacillus sp. WLX1005 TaxID=3243766 RepID=UPI0039842FEE